MFRSDQITTPTRIVRNFSRIARTLREDPQAILITQKHEHHLVLVNADIFEDLLEARFQLDVERKLRNAAKSDSVM